MTTRTFDGGSARSAGVGPPCACAPKWYQRRITRHVHEPATEFGIGSSHEGSAREPPLRQKQRSPLDAPGPTRLTLLRQCGVTYSESGSGATGGGKWVNSHQNRSFLA
ncbi:hypothetical protein ACFU8Q_37055 [Streptomyces sp. NPDC057543]|uniref:hypothetical protein n=1 Tax=Streptomyces sp. NPDC057543 TaxID=3346163 RepID=UPI003693E238